VATEPGLAWPSHCCLSDRDKYTRCFGGRREAGSSPGINRRSCAWKASLLPLSGVLRQTKQGEIMPKVGRKREEESQLDRGRRRIGRGRREKDRERGKWENAD
jgi:hypothetical protein